MRLILFLFPILLSAQVTNLLDYLPPSPPSLPAAGSTFPDPVFGTTLLRVTDSSTDASYCWHDYAYFDVLNLDSTLLQVNCVGGRYWFTFNPITLALGTKNAFPLNPDGGGIAGDSIAQWSSLTPKKMFVVGSSQKTLWSTVDITQGSPSWVTVKVFSSGLPAGTDNIGTTRISRDDDVFAILTRNSGTTTGCIAWKKSTDTILYSVTITSPTSHGCGIDKTGRYFSENYDSGATIVCVVDLQNSNTRTCLTSDTPDYAPGGHNDNGRNFIVATNGNFPSPFGARMFRLWATPTSFTAITGLTNSDGHISCRNDDEQTCTSEYYRNDGLGTLPWRGEISSYFIDGSNRYIRYAHHFSIPDDAGTDPYRAQPQATISRDGQFIIFNSNWGDVNNRIDVFLVQSARHSTSPMGFSF